MGYIDRISLSPEVYTNKLLHLHLLGLKVVGHAIFFDQHFRWLHWLRGFIITLSFISFNVTQIMDLVNSWGNVKDMLQNAPTTLIYFTTVFRMFHFYTHRERYMKLVVTVYKDLSSIEDYGNAEENGIYEKHSSYMFKITMALWIPAVMTGILMYSNTLIAYFRLPRFTIDEKTGLNTTTEIPLIIQSWFPFEDMWENFPIVYAVHVYALGLGMLIIPCWHSFIVSLMIYSVIRLDIINYKMMNIQILSGTYLKNISPIQSIQNNNELLTSNWSLTTTSDDMGYKILAWCVSRQVRIKRFVNELESLLSGAVFLDFVIFSVLICALLFQVSQASFGIELAIGILYLNVIVVMLWLYYWHADEIYQSSDHANVSLYCSTWYQYSLRFQKACLFFMTGSLKPIRMKSGFISLTLTTYMGVLRASYSYFTILSNMDK